MKNLNLATTYLGIELGSTRIKAILIDDNYQILASSSYTWENHFSDGYWTYSLDEIHSGLQECFSDLSKNVFQQFGIKLTTVGAMGISAMMHGYMVFDKNWNQLVPFRTWRNTTTEKAAKKCSDLFQFHIPQRWSIAHLYQAILNGESHISQIDKMTTLAGYIHFMLSGRHEVGIGEASGMFPIHHGDFNKEMASAFEDLEEVKLNKNILNILPQICKAGKTGAYLTKDGAHFLDPSGTLQPGIPIAPPEGDAGTGMVATNSVLPKTGNISAGTSIFSMLVLERPLKNAYPEIDTIVTPEGLDVAMVHCNNCCGELDNWVGLFYEFSRLAGMNIEKSEIYQLLYENTENADLDCGGITAINYISGEHITGINTGFPFYYRTPQCNMNLANFIKAQLCSCIATLKFGMDILFNVENVAANRFLAHGGLFKVDRIAQSLLANALNTPISVCTTAAEGGAWGMALLSAYMIKGNRKSLGDWLNAEVFSTEKMKTICPDTESVFAFHEYMDGFKKGVLVEQKLEEILKC